MSNASARRATSVPIAPTPTRPTVFPASTSSDANPQRSGSPLSQVSGKRLTNASIDASTNSAIGTAFAPREHVNRRPSITSSGKPSTPVLNACSQRTPGTADRSSASRSRDSTSMISASGARSSSRPTTTSSSPSASCTRDTIPPPGTFTTTVAVLASGLLILARSRRCAPGHCGPARCSPVYPAPNARSCGPF
jgi:hypothetical protein